MSVPTKEMQDFLERKIRDFMVSGGSREQVLGFVNSVYNVGHKASAEAVKSKSATAAPRRMPGHAKRGALAIASIQPVLARALKDRKR